MTARLRLPVALVLGLSLLPAARVESNPTTLEHHLNLGTAGAVFVPASGVVLAPSGTDVVNADALRPSLQLRLGTGRAARRQEQPKELVSVGEWSDLRSGPPSQRLHPSATYDPLRERVIVFGGLSHLWVLGDLCTLSLDASETWHHVDPPVSPPPRWGHTAIYDALRDRLVIFGGAGDVTSTGSSYPLGDVWALSLATLTWTQLSPSGPGPSPRFAHAAIYDPGGDRMIVFGGYDGSFCSDVWELALAGDGAWAELVPRGDLPPALDAAAAAYDPVGERLIVAGGFDGGKSRNDVWALSLRGQPRWTAIHTVGPTPSERRQHAAIYDPVRDSIVLFGGASELAGSGFDEVWALPLRDSPPLWRRLIPPAGTSPSRRWGHSMLYDPVSDRAIVFGGIDLLDWRNDTWGLSLSDPAWTALAVAEIAPPARWGHASVLDVTHDRLLVFMGAGQSRWLPETWALDLRGQPTWHELAVTGMPSGRALAAAIRDPVRDRVLLFGGSTGWNSRGYPFADLWQLSLAETPEWKQLSPAWTPADSANPGPRAAHTAVYDSRRDRMLVFGGFDGTQERNDVWVLSLSEPPVWSPLEVEGDAPGARQDHSAVYDPARDCMIVFGGTTTTRPSGYDDVWALVLGPSPHWIRVATGAGPGPRWGQSAIWDETHDRMLVFAGAAPEGPRNDTWSLTFPGSGVDSGEWRELDPGGTAPPRRAWQSALLDASRNRMLVFGGWNDVAFFDDVSSLDLGPASRVAHGARSGDAGGPGVPEAATGPDIGGALAIDRLAVDPERGSLEATLRVPAPGWARVELADVRGRRVASRALNGASGARHLSFDLGALPRGVYWLRVEQNGRSVAAKFVRVHR